MNLLLFHREVAFTLLYACIEVISLIIISILPDWRAVTSALASVQGSFLDTVCPGKDIVSPQGGGPFIPASRAISILRGAEALWKGISPMSS